MGYRPQNQALEPALTKIIEGMEEFDAAAVERIKSQDWKDDHVREINELRKKFMDLHLDLIKLRAEVW